MSDLPVHLLVPLVIALFVVPLIFTRVIKPLLRMLLRVLDFFSDPQARQSLTTESFRTLLRRLLRDDSSPPVFTPTVRSSKSDEHAAISDALAALQNGKAQVYTGADLKQILGNAGTTKVFSSVTVNGKPVPVDSGAINGLLQAVGASLSNASTAAHIEPDTSVERDVGERMRMLQELHRRGIITNAEFEAKKSDILRDL